MEPTKRLAHVRKRVFAAIHRLPMLALPLVFLGALLFLAEARAEPLLTIQTGSSAESTGVTDYDNIDLFSPLLLPLTHNPRLSAVGSYGSSTLDMDLESSFGNLGARVDAQSSVGDETPNVLSRTLTLNYLSWTDSWIVISSTLASGTPVDIVARLSLTGDVGNAGLTSLIVGTTESLERSLQAGLQIGVAGAENIWFDVSSTLREPVATIDEFGFSAFTVNVGQSFDILSFLQFQTTTLAFNDPSGFGFEPISNLLVDASNSARFGIEVLTAGASLDSESGATYPTDPRAISEIPVTIDIKPDDDANSIALCGAGVIPVAIFGSDDFPVSDIDISSLRLGDGTPESGSEVKMAGKSGKELCSTEDVDSDGFDDLVCKFVTVDLDLDGSATDATVLGSTTGAEDFVGTDSVNIVKDCG